MKKTLITMFMLLAGSLALTAASQSQDQPQMDNPPAQGQMSQDHITVTGCLEQGTSPNTYVLNHAMRSNATSSYSGQNDQNMDMPSNDQNQAMNPSDQDNNSQMPTEEARTENNSYVLIPDTSSKVDLKSHIGHKVEITGEMMRDGSTTNEMSQSQSSTQTSGQPEIRVMSIRHIAETCQ